LNKGEFFVPIILPKRPVKAGVNIATSNLSGKENDRSNMGFFDPKNPGKT
jgi:hypothetical protein